MTGDAAGAARAHELDADGWAAATTRSERPRPARGLLAGVLGFAPPADLVTRLEDAARRG